MNYFISGGCKNGKSMYAQTVAKAIAEKKGVPLYYVATMIPHDDEDRARIKRHVKEREGWGFSTIEQGTDICSILKREDVDSRGVFLLDSVTALLSNEMFRGGAFDEGAGERVAAQVLEFAEKSGNTVFVSDYIYSDARIFDQYTEKYRQALGLADRRLAAVCQAVVEVTFGQRIYHRGREGAAL